MVPTRSREEKGASVSYVLLLAAPDVKSLTLPLSSSGNQSVSSFSTWSADAPTLDDILQLHDTLVNEDGTVVILEDGVDIESEQKEHVLASHVFHWNSCMNHFLGWKAQAAARKVGLVFICL